MLKGNCEKSRADSGCLVVSWQQAWQEVFLSPPTTSLLPSTAPLSPLPLCLVLCIIKTSLPATSQPTTRPFWGQFLWGSSASRPWGWGLGGVKPPETGFVFWNQGLSSIWQPSARAGGSATRPAPSPRTSSSVLLSPPFQVPVSSVSANSATGHCQALLGLCEHPHLEGQAPAEGGDSPRPAASSSPVSWSGLRGTGTQRMVATGPLQSASVRTRRTPHLATSI